MIPCNNCIWIIPENGECAIAEEVDGEEYCYGYEEHDPDYSEEDEVDE